MHLAHDPALLDRLREPSPADPWRILLSGCLFGWGCGIDGSSNGDHAALRSWLSSPLVRLVPFCPEDVGMGTPRSLPDLHGGDGFAVLEGRARVLDENGRDLTEPMLVGARAMLARAREARVDFALLMDMSAACGSEVLSDGCRLVPERRYQRGVGVATAMLMQAGIPVVSQRDFRTLGRIRARLEPGFSPDPEAGDHWEHPWVREYFGPP